MKYWPKSSNITTTTLDGIKMANGRTRAMIYNGQLYIIPTKSKAEDHRRKMIATLRSIHWALIASAGRNGLANIELVFDNAEDVRGNGHPLWVLARNPSEGSLWLMPDFGCWA